ncbi:MAG: TlpA family protein disulfide reductase [Cyanobacteria bacterium SZAS TMP-1]|nr:TlpA family protein disulfide reductase [Cyanobacteria bacterium SZAS TMP-1]
MSAAIKVIRFALSGLFALCCGHWALLTLQDFDRQNVALPQHVWFMLLVVLGVSALAAWLCKRAFFGALLAALLGMILPTVFLPGYSIGYTYWEQRPDDVTTKQAIVGPTVDGGNFDIKNCKGKLLLVDYWATWCGPCVAGLPHVMEVWDKYHDQGLDVVGVSLDYDAQHLADFVTMHEMPWPQIVFQEKGKIAFNNPIAAANKVNAIPQLDLVEPQSGMIVTTVANGKDLNWTVKAALDALNKKPLAELDITNKRLATVSILPYIFGIAGGIIGALLELFGWRKLSPSRPKLRIVK